MQGGGGRNEPGGRGVGVRRGGQIIFDTPPFILNITIKVRGYLLSKHNSLEILHT